MRRIILLLGSCVAMLFASVLPGWSADREVPGSYPTIQAAVSAAQDGDRIVITGQHEELGEIFCLVSGLTFTSGATRGEVRGAHFLIAGSGVTFRDLDINGKNLAGQRVGDATDLVIIQPSVGSVLIEGCNFKNPTPGDEVGNTASENGQMNPGCCVDLRTPGPVTVRNSTFINDEETPSALNEVGLHFDYAPPGGEGVGPVLVESCSFKCTSSNIRFTYRGHDITVRNCNFSAPDIPNDRDAFAAAGLYFNVLVTDPDGLTRDVLVEGCTFDGPADTGQIFQGIYCTEALMDNVVFRNNHFTNGMTFRTITYWSRGTNLSIEDNLFEGRPTDVQMLLRVQSTVGINILSKGDPRLTWKNCRLSNNTFLCGGVTARAIQIMENYLEGVVVEGNTAMDTPSDAFAFVNPPHALIARNNHFERCGGPDTGGLRVAGKYSAVVGNFFLDCQNGVVIAQSLGDYGSTANPQLDRRSEGILVSRNIALRSLVNGIVDRSVDSGTVGALTWQGRSAGIRYINNTVVNSAGHNMALRGDALEVYNNLLIGGAGGVADYQGPGNATFTKLGFNLIYQSPYRNISFLGGATAATTDVVGVFPQLAGGFSYSSAADVVPQPGSPAVDAGSADGITPDYITDIGAVETDAVTDTSVPATGWELFR